MSTVTIRRRESVETHGKRGYAAMMRRMVRAYGRRVAECDPIDLADMVQVQKEMDAAIRAAVQGMREREYSWSEIADGLGITRQTAWERFRK